VDGHDLVEDLIFTGHYYLLRALLYYTYNVPGSVAWSFDGDRIENEYADASIIRQFYIVANNSLVGSIAALTAREAEREWIAELLRDIPEFALESASTEALPLIQAEVDSKLSRYFCMVTDMSVDVGGYTYADFLTVYRALLTKALYHRYHSHVNAARGAVKMPLATLVADIDASIEEVSAETARAVLTDITYGLGAKRARLNPAYFSLVHLADRDEVVMMPHDFSDRDGAVSFLRR
jgi:hypothetical protein